MTVVLLMLSIQAYHHVSCSVARYNFVPLYLVQILSHTCVYTSGIILFGFKYVLTACGNGAC